MDKGIRPYACALFVERLPARVATREGNTAFRKGIIVVLEEEFGITHASGATHYNYAFDEARKLPDMLAMIKSGEVPLGRPEDKKGGRKPKMRISEVAAAMVETPAPVEPPAPVETPAAPAKPAPVWPFAESYVAPQEQPKVELGLPPEDAAAVKELIESTPAAPQKFVVRRKKDQVVVAEFDSIELAEEAIYKARASKKATLELVA